MLTLLSHPKEPLKVWCWTPKGVMSNAVAVEATTSLMRLQLLTIIGLSGCGYNHTHINMVTDISCP